MSKTKADLSRQQIEWVDQLILEFRKNSGKGLTRDRALSLAIDSVIAIAEENGFGETVRKIIEKSSIERSDSVLQKEFNLLHQEGKLT